jgi:hypothetical protein
MPSDSNSLESKALLNQNIIQTNDVDLNIFLGMVQGHRPRKLDYGALAGTVRDRVLLCNQAPILKPG